nr:hypothetical protein Cbor_21 [Cedratvirus borely]WIL03869.1 hypothetical protein Cplu_16 [Cedratvirus plubellavi]
MYSQVCAGIRFKLAWTLFSIAFVTYFLSWLFLFLIYKFALDVHSVADQMLYSFISAFPLSGGLIIILVIFYNIYTVCKPEPYGIENDSLLTEIFV